MTGSITIKNGKYFAVLNVYENGVRRRKWINTNLPAKSNKRKAEQFLREKIAEYELLEGIVHTDVSLSNYVRIWLEHIARKVDIVTLQGYQTLADGHILPYFDESNLKLRDVDHRILQKYIDEKSHHGRKDGMGGLSPRSLRLHNNILHQTLDMAVMNKLIPSNPCQFVILPKTERHEASFYDTQQLQDLFDAIKDEPILPLIKITALYGLRRSELLGLKWDSINFQARTMTIKHTVCKVTKIVEKDKTKNASSYRTFPLTDEAEEIFNKAKKQEQRNRASFGKMYTENEYIFKWADGRPYTPDYVSHKFSRLLKKHNLPHIRFHELRHSCASILITLGFSLKDIQEWLGHSDIKMTANIYAHLDVARKNKLAESLTVMLNDQGGRKVVDTQHSVV